MNETVMIEDDEIINDIDLETLIEPEVKEEQKEKQLKLIRPEAQIELERQKCLSRENDYKIRFAALKNPEQTCQQLGLPPADIYFNQHILYNRDLSLGASNMLKLEEKDAELYKFKLVNTWSEARREKYKLIDPLFQEASAEKEVGDDRKMKEYLKQRKQIQLDIPKVTMD